MSRARMQQGILMAALAGMVLMSAAHADIPDEAGGIWMSNAAKDISDGIKIRGWFSGYFVNNFNQPIRAVVRANHGASVVKHHRDTTIEGRTFDVRRSSPRLDLWEVEIEKIPGAGQLGFKVDVALGDTMAIMKDTIEAGTERKALTGFDRVFQHASISFATPGKKPVRFDFGKLVTHIGGETIEHVKNHNFSHAFFYTYAIPFQQYGLRVNYPFTDKFYGELYILQGWNVMNDNNSGKTFGLTGGWTLSKDKTLYLNWLGGPELTGDNGSWRNLIDAQLFWNPGGRVKTLFNFDFGWDANIGSAAKWRGITAIVRYKLTKEFDPALRIEWYHDPQGFTTGVAQTLWGFTLTFDYRLNTAGFTKMILRPEIRYDTSSSGFFTRRSTAPTAFRSKSNQFTFGLGLVQYF